MSVAMSAADCEAMLPSRLWVFSGFLTESKVLLFWVYNFHTWIHISYKNMSTFCILSLRMSPTLINKLLSSNTALKILKSVFLFLTQFTSCFVLELPLIVIFYYYNLNKNILHIKIVITLIILVYCYKNLFTFLNTMLSSLD